MIARKKWKQSERVVLESVLGRSTWIHLRSSTRSHLSIIHVRSNEDIRVSHSELQVSTRKQKIKSSTTSVQCVDLVISWQALAKSGGDFLEDVSGIVD